MPPPLPYLLDTKGGEGGGQAVKAAGGGGRGGQLQQSVGQRAEMRGDPDPPPNLFTWV